MTGKAGKPLLAQVNKLKRQERLDEIEEILQENKAQQDEITRKLDDARSLGSTEEVGELQIELSKVQNQQVSLQIEQKELKKKQRRSERYYNNKTSKDGSLGGQKVGTPGEDASDPSMENTPEDGEMAQAAAENAEEEAMTLIEQGAMEASGETEEGTTPPTMTLQPNPAVVTEILPPASGIASSAGSSTIPISQRPDAIHEEEPVARALYSAFIPPHLQGEESQQAEGTAALANYASTLNPISRAQVHHTISGATATSDPTINALLSLAAKDKTVIQGVPVQGMPGLTLMPVTSAQGGATTSLPGITVVMPSHLTPQGNVQWS